MKRILLCCGAGMSSGFIAQSMRKQAKKEKLDIKIDAVSVSDVGSYLAGADLLLVGPHLTYEFDGLKLEADIEQVPMMVIPEKIYGSLDGTGLLRLSLDEINK
ncbi:MAG: PTS sugar transporter subunit IIB [Erysipelotrichaceae bacterium]